MPPKTIATPIAVSKREAILKPKKCGLTGNNKPVAVVVRSPHDQEDASTKFKSTIAILGDAGFGLLNKGSCDWNMDGETLAKALKTVNMNGAPLIIWVEAHGASGWFFGETNDPVDEFNSTAGFRQFILKIATLANASIATVVLNGCFTANELFSSETTNFLLSPARMLSLMVPKIKVIGFVGKNASAKIVDVFEKKEDGSYSPLTLNPEDASTLYESGNVIESSKIPLYCNHGYTHDFMTELLEIDETNANNEKVYYLASEGVLEYMKKSRIPPYGYGAQQLAWLASLPKSSVVIIDETEDEEDNIDEKVIAVPH